MRYGGYCWRALNLILSGRADIAGRRIAHDTDKRCLSTASRCGPVTNCYYAPNTGVAFLLRQYPAQGDLFIKKNALKCSPRNYFQKCADAFWGAYATHTHTQHTHTHTQHNTHTHTHTHTHTTHTHTHKWNQLLS